MAGRFQNLLNFLHHVEWDLEVKRRAIQSKGKTTDLKIGKSRATPKLELSGAKIVLKMVGTTQDSALWEKER